MFKQPILDDLMNHLTHKLKAVPKKAVETLAQKITELPEIIMNEMRSKIKNTVKRNIEDFEQKVDKIQKKLQEEALQAIRGPRIKIEIETSKIKLARTGLTTKLIEGKAVFSRPPGVYTLSVPCFVSCGHWERLGDIKTPTINLIDHLHQLLPTQKDLMAPNVSARQRRTFVPYARGPVGLVTFQNGIMNTKDEFEVMATTIVSQFPEKPLCIGLYNPTSSILPVDMYRFLNEPVINPVSVYSLCQLVKTLAEVIPQINPLMLWAHFAHSEAGLIANAVIDLCQQPWLKDTKAFMKSNLLTATYGAVKPIASDHVFHAVNTYSKNDIALFFGHHFVDKDIQKIQVSTHHSTKKFRDRMYHITVVDSKTPKKAFLNNPLKMPKILTTKEVALMSWAEQIAYARELEDAPWVTNTLINSINDIVYNIEDHGFKEPSYQSQLEANVQMLRDRYTIYSGKKTIR